MAIYRNVQMSFWTDTKIDEDFTPEDKYFYLYLFTNPHTNLCGCYELGLKQASRETGYNDDTIARLIERFENVHGVIAYSKATREILLLNWHKYNWTKSADFMSGLEKHIEKVKNPEFKRYLNDLSNGVERVYRRSADSGGTSVTVTDTVTDTVTVSYNNEVNTIYTDAYKKIIDYLNMVSESNYRWQTRETQKLIKARLKDGYTVADFMTVIDKKKAEWGGTDFECYLRPKTLFGNNFESYLNQKQIQKRNNKGDDFDEWGQMLNDERGRYQAFNDD